jgi:endonuclease/exonuclease/phosphatase family metal-dependent hydrolase
MPSSTDGPQTLHQFKDHADAAQFSIATYNILADCYVRIPEQPWNAFAHCRDEDIRYEDRQTKITKQLLDVQADIVCLQEVMLEKRTCKESGDDLWSLPTWTDALIESGYVGIMQGLSQKEWEKNSQRNHRMVGRPIPTGVASFYRSEIWEEIEPAKHGTGSGTVLFLKKRNFPALQIAVGNTHLVGDPKKAEAHLQQLCGLQKNMAKCPQCVRLICGDMNGDCAHGSDVGSWIKEQVQCLVGVLVEQRPDPTLACRAWKTSPSAAPPGPSLGEFLSACASRVCRRFQSTRARGRAAALSTASRLAGAGCTWTTSSSTAERSPPWPRGRRWARRTWRRACPTAAARATTPSSRPPSHSATPRPRAPPRHQAPRRHATRRPPHAPRRRSRDGLASPHGRRPALLNAVAAVPWARRRAPFECGVLWMSPCAPLGRVLTPTLRRTGQPPRTRARAHRVVREARAGLAAGTRRCIQCIRRRWA